MIHWCRKQASPVLFVLCWRDFAGYPVEQCTASVYLQNRTSVRHIFLPKIFTACKHTFHTFHLAKEYETRSRILIESMETVKRREIIYCKRAILSLSSSKILTPHPPLPQASVSSPPTKAGGTHSPGGEGDRGSIFWKTREIGLPSYSK